MKKIAFFFIFSFSLFLWFLPFNVRAENYQEKEIIVKYKNSANEELLYLEQGDNFDKILSDYQKREDVLYAEPNFLYHSSMIPSDTYFENQWYLKKIKANIAWDTKRESEDIVIAIIDSGVDINHPDLKDNIWKNIYEIPQNGIDDDKNGYVDDVYGWDFVNNVSDPSPKFSEGFTRDGVLHGTIVAGVAAASGNNASGISGVTWRSKIMSLKVLDDKGEGDTLNVVKAIDYAVKNGANIINFSFVGSGYSRSLELAIKRAYDAGVIMVAAAGNDQGEGTGYSLDQSLIYPACDDGNNGENMVIGVAATDALDQKAPFSSYGFKCVDISAPGISIFSTSVYNPEKSTEKNNFNSYYDGYWSGTSMAAPIISGSLALIESANPKFSRNEVLNNLFQNSDNISRLNPNYIGRLGWGRVNLAKSIFEANASLVKDNYKLLISPQTDSEPLMNIVEANGKKINTFFAYDQNFRGGVNVASGDIDGDGIDEIITGAGHGGGPHVRIFDKDGKVKGQFFAYDQNFRGGVNVAVANIRGSFRGIGIKIITAPSSNGGTHIKIFSSQGNLLSHFFAYDQKFRGGVNISSIDLDNDGSDEILTGAGPGGAPHVRIFTPQGVLKKSFYALDATFSGGVKVYKINY